MDSSFLPVHCYQGIRVMGFMLAFRNLEVLSNEDLGSNPKNVGSMAAALQCQIWVQFDNHTNFCKALHAFCGRAMHKAR